MNRPRAHRDAPLQGGAPRSKGLAMTRFSAVVLVGAATGRPKRPPCLKGAGTEGDWGILCRAAAYRPAGEYPSVTAAPCHLPLGKGGFGAVAVREMGVDIILQKGGFVTGGKHKLFTVSTGFSTGQGGKNPVSARLTGWFGCCNTIFAQGQKMTIYFT